MTRREALTMLLPAVAVLAGGCAAVMAPVAVVARLSMPDTTTIKAEYVIGAQPVVVIPLKDAARGYYESGDGIDLATTIAGELIARKAASVVRSDEMVRRQFAGQNLEQVGWAEVGKAAGADLVLVGDIQDLRLKDPGVIGMLRGYSRVNVRIFDVRKNAFVYAGQAETWCPDYGPGVATGDISPENLRNQLIAATAMNVVKKFYTWERKIGPEPRRNFGQ